MTPIVSTDSSTFRQSVHACIHPETYKYFVPQSHVKQVWADLSQLLGPLHTDPALGVRYLKSNHLIVRAPPTGNPITVIRRTGYDANDIATLHIALQYHEMES